MGSIISFPVLCVINLVTCILALETAAPAQTRRVFSYDRKGKVSCKYVWTDRTIYGRKWNPWDRRLPLLINGDDCLFSSRSCFLNIEHLRWMRIVGWTASSGKDYFSKHLATINSRAWYRDDVKSSWYCVGYVNMGLLAGVDKKGVKHTTPLDLAAVARDLVHLAPAALRSTLMRMFLFRHNDILSLPRVPLFLPLWCGGLGMPRVEDFGPSDENRAGVHLMKILGWKARCDTLAQWKVHELVKESMGDLKLTYYSGIREFPSIYSEDTPDYQDIAQVNDELYGIQTMVCLSSAGETNTVPADFGVGPKQVEKHQKRVLAHNRDLWKRIRDRLRGGQGSQLCTDNDLDRPGNPGHIPVYLKQPKGLLLHVPSVEWLVELGQGYVRPLI